MPQPGSFASMLRPYRGLREEVLQDLWGALRVCAPRIASESVERELLAALWAIGHVGRTWALDPDGMIRRNNLIADDELTKLSEFLYRFDYCVLMLLEGNLEEAFDDTT